MRLCSGRSSPKTKTPTWKLGSGCPSGWGTGGETRNATRTVEERLATRLVLAPGLPYAIIAVMETQSYWRTRSIAEAMQEGYTHLRATCPSCGRIADLPWPLLIGRKGTTRNTFLGNIPLRCQKCGNSEPLIGVRQQNTVDDRFPHAKSGS
jgi:hypothetical protein